MSTDCVARKDWTVIQGSTFDKLLIWINPKSIFTATVAGDSDATPPVWPPDIGDTVVDNTVTWDNTRLAIESDLEGDNAITEWQANTAYVIGDVVLSTRQPVDISGYSARLQIRTDKADEGGTVLFEMTSVIDANDNGIYLGTSNGEIRLVIQPGTTEGFDWDPSPYDLEMISTADPPVFPDGIVTRLLDGNFKIDTEVTRDTATVTTP